MRRAFEVVLALVLAGCATSTTTPTPTPAPAATPPCELRYINLNSALWMQSSAEYEASALQTYAAARRMLDVALADPGWSAATEQTAPASTLPPAVILDLDETALDNSTYEGRAIVTGKPFTDERWKEWVAASEATATPGALQFLEYARSRGVTPFYITNRKAGVEEEGTLRNLQKLGFPLSTSEDTLLTRGERPEWAASDKSPRRAHVASRYRVLLLLGDDLNDFAPASGKSVAERDEIIRNTAGHWGTRWFILPNPSYGSWERAITGGASGCEGFQKKVEGLRP